MGLFGLGKKSAAEKYYQKGLQCVKERDYKQAQEHLLKALEKADHKEAAYQLAVLRREGKLNFEYSVVYDLYKIAAEQGHADACYQLWLRYAERTDYYGQQEAALYLERAADQGHTSAQLRLAEAYYEGKGVKEDEAQALKYYRLAAEQGSAEGQYKVGWLLYHGRSGIKRDPKAAVEWIQKAAAQNYVEALYKLGESYQNGYLSLPEDREKAVEYWRRAAELGDVDALARVGDYYREKNELEEAVKWYQRADAKGSTRAENALRELDILTKAEKEHRAEFEANDADKARAEAESAANPARAFAKGMQYQKNGDRDAAWRWIRAAAEHGSADAQYNLAQMYIAEKYPTGADQWFRKAAENGHGEAAYALAVLLAECEIPDYFEVKKWADTALERGVNQAKPLADRLHAAFMKLESLYRKLQTARTADGGQAARQPGPNTAFDTAWSQKFARHILDQDDDAGFAIGLAEAVIRHPEVNHDDWVIVRGAWLARINLLGYLYGNSRKGTYWISGDRIQGAGQFVRLDMERLSLTKSDRAALERNLQQAEKDEMTGLQALADFYTNREEVHCGDELLLAVGTVYYWRICDLYRIAYEERYRGAWQWGMKENDRQSEEDALKLMVAWHKAAVTLKDGLVVAAICREGLKHRMPYFCALIDTPEGCALDHEEAIRYLEIAENAGYDVAKRIAHHRRELEEIAWEMGRAEREARYEAVRKQEEDEKRKEARRKELDEKLDWFERTVNSDGLTNDEQHFVGKRDVYDKMKDEALRNALHDLLD